MWWWSTITHVNVKVRSRSSNVSIVAPMAWLAFMLTSYILYTAAHSSSCFACALSSPTPKYRIGIIGGGSSGMLAAASIVDSIQNHDDDASHMSDCIDVKIYESTGEVLRTIRAIQDENGGILYDTSKKPREILNMGYPRGRKEIASLLTKTFSPMMQQRWFEDRGVEFKTQLDGTMAVTSSDDDSSSDGMVGAILQDGVQELIETNAKILCISKDDQEGGFQLTIQHNDGNNHQVEQQHCDCVILATGNSHLGHQLAKSLGHTIATPARSCFGFKLSKDDDPVLSNLNHGSVDSLYLPYIRLSYKVKVNGQKRPRVFKSEGSAQLEIIRNNHDVDDINIILGGNAALSLSSTTCFELREANYKGSLFVHFCPDHLGGKVEKLEEFLWQYRQDNPNTVVGAHCPLLHHQVDYDDYDWETDSFKTVTNECTPSELWESLTEACGIAHGSPWSKTSPKKVRKLSEMIVGCPLEFIGRSTGRNNSFINAGGILLNEIDMSTMESKVVDGLFCCGQILDGDASLTSFSLMRDFATGKMAGENAVLNAIKLLDDLNQHNHQVE